ncbi:MAG: fibronectin type III domain-containing protein [Bryobacteraceae bacterium]
MSESRHDFRILGLSCLPLALVLTLSLPCNANVPAPPTPPPPPAGYCSLINTELTANLAAFNSTLNILPPSGHPTVYAANLSTANANSGPQITNVGYLPGVLAQLQEIKATGAQAVMIQVGFPVLYRPFYPTGTSGTSQYNSVVTFYQQLAAAVRSLGMKIIVENDILLSGDVQAGWTNTTTFYGGLTWSQYTAARAQDAATVASTIQPDFLVLAEEPDNEATQSGQANINNPVMAASMISQEIAAVRALNLPNIKLGAGFGTWVTGLLGAGGYLQEYTALNVAPNNLDYIDFHVYPTFVEAGNDFLQNTLTIATAAQQAGMGVGISEAWMWKMEAAEWNVLSPSDFRGRNPFSFWAPLDVSFLQTIQNLASRTQMLYEAPEGPYYLFNYQTFGGTVANGGLVNCTCTTASCSSSEIINDTITLTAAANQQALYTMTGLSYNSFLVPAHDTTAPTTPTGLSGSAGYNQASVSWNVSTDNVGVAGYNVTRSGGATGPMTVNSVSTTFLDSGLTAGTTYHYQISAFDLAGNTSSNSTTLDLTTQNNIPPTTPTSLTATAVSPQEIDLSWAAPQDTSTLASYRIFRGDSPSSLAQVATRPSTSTIYKDIPLTPQTQYYYGVEAINTSGLASPMSNIVFATTLALPSSPTNLVATATSAKQIKLTWAAGSTTGTLPTVSYHVLQGTAPGLLKQVSTTTTTAYTANNLAGSTAYYFEVQAVDTVGDISVPSTPATATTYAVPNPPGNLTAMPSSATKITLAWTETVPAGGLPISTYKVFCGTSPSLLTQVATAKSSPYSYLNLTPMTTYYCAFEAVDTAQDVSIMSATASATTPPMPNPPVNVTGVPNSASKITLTWTETLPQGGLAVSNYKVSCGTSAGSLAVVATVTSATYSYTGRAPATTYYCGVQAVDKGSDVSPMSAVVSTTTYPLPNTPTNVTATASSSTSVAVTWADTAPTGYLPIANYKVFRGSSPTSLSQVATRTTPSYTDTTVTAGTTYYYAVEAVDTGGDVSAMSTAALVTTP